jgi:hypothetical protein
MSLQYANPNIAKTDALIKRLASLPGIDPQTRMPIAQLALQRALQARAPGTPEYLLVAGELQSFKDMQLKAAAGQNQQPPVIQTLLENAPQGQPQQAMPPAPEEAGVAALPAQNLEGLDQPQYASGGIVAFQSGGEPRVPSMLPSGMRRSEDPQVLRAYYLSRNMPIPPELMTAEERKQTEKAPYPAGVFPKMGRFFSDVGESVSGFVAPEGLDFYSKDVVKPKPVASTKDLAKDFKDTSVGENLGPAATNKAAPAAPTSRVPAGMFGTIDQFMAKYYPSSGKTVPTTQEAVAQERAAFEGAGVDLDPNKAFREQITAERDARAGDKEKAGWQALAQFGLGLASTPGDFLSAIGRAGLPAIKEYAGEVKELKKLAREDERLINQLNLADNQLKMGVTQSALGRREKIAEQLDAERGRAATIAASVAGGIMSLQAAKEGRVDQKDDRLVKQAQDAAIKVVNEGVTKFKTPTEKEAEISRLTSVFYTQLKDLQSGKVVPQAQPGAGWGMPRVKTP